MNVSKVRCLLAVLLLSGCTSLGQGKRDSTSDPADEQPEDANTITVDESTSATSVADLLEGRVAGVDAYETASGGIAIRIRGASSIRGSDAPLYVIDGMPTAPGPDGELPVSIYEIDSIRVLKDKAATVRYGVRGAYGVILITTKRPPDPDE